MRIKSLTLENIRSYTNKRIEFPEGSILLSGNIGSGKTSLLLAIDFVLFGLRKGNLSGSSLLRKGQDRASVELNFEVSNKDIVIKRKLKKGQRGISQEAGVISIDGVREELSPVELRQRVLDLFKYPKESLTKTKDLIYSYTVYTPQEEMKSILLANSDDRLNILRKVFGIDKYKRVVENCKFLISDLKSKKKEFDILSSDLEHLVEDKKKKEGRIREIVEDLDSLRMKLGDFKKEIDNKKEGLEEIEKKNEKRENLKRDLEILNNKIESLVNQKSRDSLSIKRLGEEINVLDKEIGEFKQIDPELISKKILNFEEDFRRIELENREISKKIGEFEYTIRNSEKLRGEINELDVCPVCEQKVSGDHKHNISRREELKLKDIRETFENYKIKEKENDNLILEIKTNLEGLRKEKNRIELFKIKKENRENKRRQLEELLSEQNKIKNNIGEENSQKLGLSKILESLVDFSEEYVKIKKELEEILKLERETNSEYVAFEREINMIRERVRELSLDILNKEKLKVKIIKYSEMITFLEREFTPLVSLVEKQIMRKVHSDFDKLFKEWFRILVDNVDLEVSLGYDFSVICRQNGYDTEYGHLSGGERTASALAYRLALNQVINTIMSEINTKDILILDEPTDGFSSEQVDKLRIILEELKIKQIIMVSHDPKIESFVDNVIRFEKKEGETHLG
jgi:DNA repair protein SbcC/Rad50